MKPIFIDVTDTRGHKTSINTLQIAQIYEDGGDVVIELSSGTTIEVRTHLSILQRQIGGNNS